MIPIDLTNKVILIFVPGYEGSPPSNWKPWAEPPLTAQFKIAFEVNPLASKLPLRMDIRETYNRFVVTKR